MTRHAISFLDQSRQDYEAFLSVARDVLEHEHGILPGHAEHQGDVAATLARFSPALPADTAMAIALGQREAARELVAVGLRTLKEIDPWTFHPSPSVKRLALLKMRALGTRDLQSALTNTELDSVAIRRRQFADLARRMVAQGRAADIPDEASARALPDTLPPGLDGGGVAASRASGWQRARSPIDGE